MNRLIITLAVCISLTGCTSAPVTPPAPTQSIDQQMAGWLLTAQTAIEGLQPLVATYPGLKDPLNRVIVSYNTVESAYLVYHAALAAGGTPDATVLATQIKQLSASVAAVTAIYGGK